MPIIMHATMPIKPEAREMFLAAVPGLIEASNADEGVLSYELYEAVATPNTFVMLEVYADKAGMDAHLGSPHFQAAMPALGQVLAGAPTLTYYEAGDAQTLAL
ncbi:putative quinol monooxygenase [Sporichthya sp.]|uniref:putative quinol monooxygenase n=1 Tax=Sporichthya sp. TaxID=65475 RepID=UPI0018290F46|nr:putative quinol monooxygenase [Sporichthya sp.]MBA3742126.1 antibiotic biosynthesis monooxygenase [Sporichthya sp.]